MVANHLPKSCTNSTHAVAVGSLPLNRGKRGGVDGGVILRLPEATCRAVQSIHSR